MRGETKVRFTSSDCKSGTLSQREVKMQNFSCINDSLTPISGIQLTILLILMLF